jgi:hypothetical protein
MLCVCDKTFFLDTTQDTGFRECVSCDTVDGVDCSSPGVTVANMPLKPSESMMMHCELPGGA